MMLAPPNNLYWEQRAQLRMQSYQRSAQDTIRAMQNAYDGAQSRINAAIRELLDRYARRYGLDPAQARAILNERIAPEQHKKLKSILDQLGGAERSRIEARLNLESFRYRISNLENLRESVNIACAQIADIEIQRTTERLIDTAKDAYDRVEYDMQKGLGVGWSTSGINQRKVKQLLREDWSGRHYSDRIWSNTRTLSRVVQESMLEWLMSGKGYKQIIEQVALDFDTGLAAASRLIMTEVCYIANASELERYQEEGVKRYLYIAILDHKTSDICAERDGKTYPVSEAEIGKNFPPMHPWCRSSTGPAMSQEWIESIERSVTDPKTGEIQRIPVTAGYAWWRQHYRDAA